MFVTRFLAPADEDGGKSTPDVQYDEALGLSVDSAGVPLVERREASFGATETRGGRDRDRADAFSDEVTKTQRDRPYAELLDTWTKTNTSRDPSR
ncbi:MAG: hypothetical protein ACLP50_31960 [Solirubrobacteraceae bacterium]